MHSCLPFLCLVLRTHSLLLCCKFTLCLLAHTYTTFLIPQPHPYLLFQTKSFCTFHMFHMCSLISNSPLEHNCILAIQPQMPPLHILPAKHRSSSSKATLPLLLPLPALGESRSSTQEQLPPCQKASNTSEPHYRHLTEAMPKPPHTHLSSTFSLK